VLPLDLHQGLDGSGEARTWLLPALRRHVAGASLCYWARHLLPLTREMGQAAAAASQRGNKVCLHF
jgi:ribosomal RNA-processing protein 12